MRAHLRRRARRRRQELTPALVRLDDDHLGAAEGAGPAEERAGRAGAPHAQDVALAHAAQLEGVQTAAEGLGEDGFFVAEPVGHADQALQRRRDVLGEAAVAVEAHDAHLPAEVLGAAPAAGALAAPDAGVHVDAVTRREGADSAVAVAPRRAAGPAAPAGLAAAGPPAPGDDLADDLFAGHPRQRQVAVPVADDLEVGAAEAGHAHPDEGFARSRLGHRQVGQLERPDLADHHCLHHAAFRSPNAKKPGPSSVWPGPPVFEAAARVAAIPFTTRDASTTHLAAGLLAPGSSSGRAFPPASRQWLLAAFVPGHSGGSAPVSHRLPSSGPHGRLQAPRMLDEPGDGQPQTDMGGEVLVVLGYGFWDELVVVIVVVVVWYSGL